MKPAALGVLATILLSGCVSQNYNVAQNQSVFHLDDRNDRASAAPRVSRKQLRNANASIETSEGEATSHIRPLAKDDDRERRQIAELSQLKANSPEWWALKKKIDGGETIQNENMRKRLTICQGC